MKEGQSFKERWVTALFSRFPFLAERWAEKFEAVAGEGIPWAPFDKEVSQCKIAIVTTAGVHLKGQTPFDMDDERGDYTFREIPGDVKVGDLMITHKYYDHTDADRDVNIIFPVERLAEMVQSGEVGGIAPRHFSFMGHIVEEKIKGLLESSAPEVAKRLSDDGVDFVLLTPG